MTDPDAVDPQQYHPEHARSERAAETPPHEDAEEMEAAMRERGAPLASAEPSEDERRQQPTEPGPGTSLT